MRLPKNLFINGILDSKKIESADYELKSMTKYDLTKLKDIRDFIASNFKSQKNFCKQISSYGLKHVVERQIGRYVANGELIAAMILEGFQYKEFDGINCFFNVNYKSIKLSDKKPSKY